MKISSKLTALRYKYTFNTLFFLNKNNAKARQYQEEGLKLLAGQVEKLPEKVAFRPYFITQSSCVKVFDRTLAAVGLNEKQLKSSGIEYLKNIVMCNSHAGYYPNAKFMTIKLLFTSEGKILGAQAAGYEGVEKRIDVISTVMRLKGKVHDLIDLELCYAPPYSSAKDPVNLLGMSSQNILDGLFKPAFYEDLKDAVIIDVRPAADYEISNIQGALSIPGGEIRKRLDEIPVDKKVVLHCRRGYTSYVAARILSGYGYDNVYSFCGGKLLYDEITKDRQQQLANV